jgi:DNA-binding XRE family transcriptional regulator
MDINDIAYLYLREDLTYQEIGDKYGVSKQAVHGYIATHRELWAKAITSVRRQLDFSAQPIGESIRRKRKLLGLSLHEVSEKVGISKPYLLLLEKDKLKTSSYYGQISKYLNSI